LNEGIQQQLVGLIGQYGRSLCDDPRRCEALLRDLCPDSKREIFVLVTSLRERVAGDLQQSTASEPIPVLIGRLTKRLEDDLGFTEDLARWCVESWALALGVIARAGTPSNGDSEQQAVKAEERASETTGRRDSVTVQALVVSQAGDGPFRSIVDAMRHNPLGCRIVVRPGLYVESLIIDRPVEIEGAGPMEDIVVESTGAPCVELQAGQAMVRGLTLHHRSSGRNGERGCVYIPRGALTIEHCHIVSDARSTSGSDSACVHVRGKTAQVHLIGCRVSDGGAFGVLFTDHSGGSVDGCNISSNSFAGVAITAGSDPTIRRCQIHNGKQDGVLVLQNGRGLVEGCDIFGNDFSGVAIRLGGAAVIRQCQIHDGKQNGVAVFQNGRGTVEGCDIFGNGLSGVAIEVSGDPVIRECRIHDGKQAGVLIGQGGRGRVEGCQISGHGLSGVEIKQGRGVLEGCDIFGNGLAGVEIHLFGDPVVRQCQIRDGKQDGVLVWQGGRGTIEGCDISGNACSGVEIREGCNPSIKMCKINRNAEHAFSVHGNVRGVIEDCDLRSNGSGAWLIDAGCQVQRSRNKE